MCIRDPRDKALFGIIYLYGLRVSEATLLKLPHVALARRTILIQRVKGGIGGERPLFEAAEKLLKRYLRVRLDTGDGLFTGRQGNLKRQRILLRKLRKPHLIQKKILLMARKRKKRSHTK